MKMWSGRFRQPLDPEFEKWQRSFPFDQRLLPEEVMASQAYAKALARSGVFTELEKDAVILALNRVLELAELDPALLNDPEVEDIHHFVEKQLVALIGESGYKLHSGRSRNEQIATDLRLYIRRQIDTVRGLLVELAAVLADRAEGVGDAAMPAFTHSQPAEPVLVAHWLLAYAEMFLRDHTRLGDCRTRVNLCPLGSGAVAGATLGLDRAALALELGFDAPTANSMDATSDRDFAIEFVHGLAMLGLHLSRLAVEFILFSTPSFGFIQLPESYSTGSSAMPQKKNPDALELVRGKSGRLLGAHTTLVTAMKGLPLAYNKDLQETQEPVFDAADTATQCLKTVIGVLSDVGFDHARMQSAATGGFTNAMAAATYLSKKGVPFRKAHEKVGNAVRYCLDRDGSNKDQDCDLQHLSLEELRTFAPEFDQDFYAAMELKQVLDCHDVHGGTGTPHVRAALAKLRKKIMELSEAEYAHT